MQTDRTTGSTPTTCPSVSDRVEAVLADSSDELAALAHRPQSEFRMLDAWPIMSRLGAKDRGTYIALRNALSAELRVAAGRLRSLKRLLREIDRLMPGTGCPPIRAEIARARTVHNALMALRRMGRAWSKAVRTGAVPGGTDAAPGRAATVLEQLAEAVRAERRARADSRAAWDTGRDNPRLEMLHGRAIDRVDALLKLADELKEE